MQSVTMNRTSPKRTICVVTGSRAEYGLLYWLLKEIQGDQDLALRLVVTGAHLSAKFGNTCKAIEDDGFTISARVDLQQDNDDTASVCNAVADGIKGFCAAYEEISPDILVVLGDRFEILAAVQTALFQRIPVAHIHGGEITTGAFDDAIRHAITKMSQIHFVSAEPYRRRLIQMGEAPDRVHLTGALALDNIARLDFMSRVALEESLGVSLGSPFFLVTYHPVTLDDVGSKRGLEAMLEALDDFPQATIIMTGVNADPGHLEIDRMMQGYAKRHKDRVHCFSSLGQRRYLSAMKLAQVVIGNSSSGIFEAAALSTPSVNIGSRQDGRLRGASIIDCAENTQVIRDAITTALSPTFTKNLAGQSVPYGDGNAAGRMVHILKKVDLENIVIKKFHDLEAVL